jgi:Zn-dependent peptidase ImmA (M78 family)
MKDTKSARAADRLEALEAGTQQPSRALILKMAHKYRRPLVTFYLDAPPARGDRGEDFRSLPTKQTDTEGLLDALLRDVRARQATVRDILLEDDAHRKVPFIGSITMQDGVAPLLAAMRQGIRLDVGEYRAQASVESAFALLRSRVEAAGVFVLLIGNLGSHHSSIDVETFRGFALADEVAPFIVINDQDAVSAWSFTLLHELAHLWLGKTGVSGRSSEAQIEKFCNDVAAEFLLPSSELPRVGVERNSAPQAAIELIEKFASERHLSRTMVAYSLYRATLLREDTWKTISAWFLSQWRKARDAKRERQRDGKGPNYYVVRRHRLGPALLHLVARSIDEGALTPTRASKVLGVKPRSVAPLLQPIDPSSGRAA